MSTTSRSFEIKVYVFSPAGSYLGMYGQTNVQGKATFDLSDGAYMFRVDYLGYQFWTDVYAVPETLIDTFQIPHQDVRVTVNKVYGSDSDPIANVKAYLFTAAGSYMGTYANTDAQGQVIFSLPEKDYKVRADYLGSQYWSEVIFWQDKDIDIDHGKVNIHVTNFSDDIENAKVYLFTETGSYLGKYANTDAGGIASFTLPVKSYKFRVDYSGSQYWSEVITPLPHGELPINLALDLLALSLTNNPKPVRFDGVPIEKKPDGIMLASIGSLTGILTQSIVAQIPEPKIYYYINDHLGTPMKVIDENNTVAWFADFTPFGEADITVDTFKNNFRFPGQYYDQESNLYYNYHRYYHPKTGRYLRADPIFQPILFIDTGSYSPEILFVLPEIITDPLTLHPYIYTQNNPINQFDSFAYLPIIDHIKCFYYSKKVAQLQKRCREIMGNTAEQIGNFCEVYGGGGWPSAAIWNCVEKMRPDVYNKMIKSCGKGFIGPFSPIKPKPIPIPIK